MRILTISIILLFSSTIFAQNFNWTPQNSGVTTSLNDVFFVNNQTGWAVGNDGVILNTVDGGQTWTLQTSDATEILRAVFFINANTGWAVGGSLKKAIIKTTDGGATWQSLPADNVPSAQMNDIAFYDENTGWLVTRDSIYRTTDGGNTWVHEKYVTSVSAPNTKVIAVTSDTMAFIGGSSRSSASTREANVFYRIPENVLNLWNTSVFDVNVKNDEVNSIDFISSDIGFTGTRNGKLFKKTDFHPGGVWELNYQLADENQSIWSVTFPDENNGTFNSSTEISGVTNGLFYHTSDGGETWSSTPDTIPDFLLVTVFAPDSANVWAVGSGGKIYKGVRQPLGIRNTSLNVDVNIYPNPATNRINVEINAESNETYNYSLSDLTGRIIKKGRWDSNSPSARFTLNISDVRQGMYFLTLSTTEGKSAFRVLKN